MFINRSDQKLFLHIKVKTSHKKELQWLEIKDI